MYKIPPKAKPVRPLGPVAVMAEHWIEVEGDRGRYRVGVPCPNFDPETEAPTLDRGCPACEAGYNLTMRYFVNIIDREAQRMMRGHKYLSDAPPEERKAKYLYLGHQHVTPVRVLSVPLSVMRTIRELEEEYNVYGGKAYPITHPKYGRDLLIRFKENAAPMDMYRVDLGKDRSPLTPEEQRYKLWDLSLIEELIGDPEENIKRLEKLLERAVDREEVAEKAKKSSKKVTYVKRWHDEEEEEPMEGEVYEAETEEEAVDEDLEDRIYEMSRKELKRFIKERGLPIKVKKSMSDDDIREAILEELGLL